MSFCLKIWTRLTQGIVETEYAVLQNLPYSFHPKQFERYLSSLDIDPRNDVKYGKLGLYWTSINFRRSFTAICPVDHGLQSDGTWIVRFTNLQTAKNFARNYEMKKTIFAPMKTFFVSWFTPCNIKRLKVFEKRPRKDQQKQSQKKNWRFPNTCTWFKDSQKTGDEESSESGLIRNSRFYYVKKTLISSDDTILMIKGNSTRSPTVLCFTLVFREYGSTDSSFANTRLKSNERYKHGDINELFTSSGNCTVSFED